MDIMRPDVPAHEFDIQALEQRLFLSSTTTAAVNVALVNTALGKQLRVTGSAAGDAITVSRRSNGFQVIAGGVSKVVHGKIASIRVDGRGGDDRITIKSNVHTATELYGGDGNDTLAGGGGDDRLYGGGGSDVTNGFAGSDTIISVGDGAPDRSVGGAGSDSFWIDDLPGEAVSDLARAELKAGFHRIASFTNGHHTADDELQLFPDPSSATLENPILTDKAEGYKDFSRNPLFSTLGPGVADIVQGQLGDCFLLASLASVAKLSPELIRNRVADLGDGTYAVQFMKRGVEVYVRVDGTLPSSDSGSLVYAQLGRQSSLWVAIVEKAYALFRDPQGRYESLQGGFMGEVYEDLGLPADSVFTSDSGSSLLQMLNDAISAGEAVTFATITKIGKVPVLSDHAYMVDKVIAGHGGGLTKLRLFNPWGRDGAGHDSKDDGYITLTASQASSVFWFACMGEL
jgi:hypothetical protein